MAVSRAMLLVSSRSLSRPLKLTCRLNYTSRINLQNVSKTSFVYHHSYRFYCEKKPSLSVSSVLNPSSGPQQPNESKSPEKENEEANKQPNNSTKWSLFGLACMFGFGALFAITEFGPPERDDQGAEIPDQYSSQPAYLAYLSRTRDALLAWKTKIKEPSREKLLPDPLKYPYHQPAYTILIELNGLLTHPDWSFKSGWRFKKRQFVDYFIQACGYPNAELILFTQETGASAEPIIESLDRQGSIIYRLYRDSTVS